MEIKFLSRRSILDGFVTAFVVTVLIAFVFNPTEEQMLDMKLNGILFAGLFILGMLLSFLFKKKNISTLGRHLFEPNYDEFGAKVWFKTFWGWQPVIFIFLLLAVGLIKVNFSFFELRNEDGSNGVRRLFAGIFNPNWNVLPDAILNIVETLFMAFIATILAVPFAFVLSFLSAKNIMTSRPTFLIYLLTRTVFNLTRSIEVILWAIIFSVWVGIGPFAGMLALMVHSIASLTKQYSEMIESVNDGPIEAIKATGANKFQTVWFGVVPQVALPFISFTVYRWDINVRMATVIGLVGGGGIGTMLIRYQGQGMWAEVGTIIVVIATVVWMMDQASAYIREALK